MYSTPYPHAICPLDIEPILRTRWLCVTYKCTRTRGFVRTTQAKAIKTVAKRIYSSAFTFPQSPLPPLYMSRQRAAPHYSESENGSTESSSSEGVMNDAGTFVTEKKRAHRHDGPTPQRQALKGSTVPKAAKASLALLAPEGKRCLLTREVEFNLNVCHLVAVAGMPNEVVRTRRTALCVHALIVESHTARQA